MPAPVPPGFTRGPIMFSGPLLEAHHADRLLQSFWDEAGSYGARVLIVPTAAPDMGAADRYRHWLQNAEVDSLAVLPVHERADALDPALVELVDNATGILITEGNPLRFTSMLGGTPVAQAIRRANARGRTICGLGSASAALCQHMIATENRQAAAGPFLHRGLIQFAPGLGIINRLAFDCAEETGAHFHSHLRRLLTALAYNPFLIGVALDPDTGVVIYANSTLEVFGAGNALLVDGWRVTHTDLYEQTDTSPMSLLGAHLHLLGHGYTYDLDAHLARRPPDSEIPKAGYEAYTSF